MTWISSLMFPIGPRDNEKAKAFGAQTARGYWTLRWRPRFASRVAKAPGDCLDVRAHTRPRCPGAYTTWRAKRRRSFLWENVAIVATRTRGFVVADVRGRVGGVRPEVVDAAAV